MTLPRASTVSLLVAAAENDVIGDDGRIPWRLPADMRRFAAMTAGHAVVMGRVTYETHLGGPSAGTPPASVIPVSVDENALDNAGTGGPYNHVRQAPADGTILAGNADKTNGIFITAGGAPIYVSNWENIGGARASTSVDQTAIDNADTVGVFSHLRAKPADNTLVQSFGTGHIFVIAGGAPLEVTSLANIGSPAQAPTPVDQVALDKAGTGGFYNHLNFKPADGTIFESFNTGKVYQVTGGVPTLNCSASQTFLYIDQYALDKAGTGGFYNHLKPLPKPAPAPCPKPTPTDTNPPL